MVSRKEFEDFYNKQVEALDSIEKRFNEHVKKNRLIGHDSEDIIKSKDFKEWEKTAHPERYGSPAGSLTVGDYRNGEWRTDKNPDHLQRGFGLPNVSRGTRIVDNFSKNWSIIQSLQSQISEDQNSLESLQRKHAAAEKKKIFSESTLKLHLSKEPSSGASDDVLSKWIIRKNVLINQRSAAHTKFDNLSVVLKEKVAALTDKNKEYDHRLTLHDAFLVQQRKIRSERLAKTAAEMNRKEIQGRLWPLIRLLRDLEPTSKKDVDRILDAINVLDALEDPLEIQIRQQLVPSLGGSPGYRGLRKTAWLKTQMWKNLAARKKR